MDAYETMKKMKEDLLATIHENRTHEAQQEYEKQVELYRTGQLGPVQYPSRSVICDRDRARALHVVYSLCRGHAYIDVERRHRTNVSAWWIEKLLATYSIPDEIQSDIRSQIEAHSENI